MGSIVTGSLIAELHEQRDAARATAVTLEQELEQVRAVVVVLLDTAEPATERALRSWLRLWTEGKA